MDYKTSLLFADKHINYTDGHLCTLWRRKKVIITGENWPKRRKKKESTKLSDATFITLDLK